MGRNYGYGTGPKMIGRQSSYPRRGAKREKGDGYTAAGSLLLLLMGLLGSQQWRCSRVLRSENGRRDSCFWSDSGKNVARRMICLDLPIVVGEYVKY